MSKPKRRSLADQLGQEDIVTSSRDDVVTSKQSQTVPEAIEEPAAPEVAPKAASPRSRAAKSTPVADPRRRSANDVQRHSYHTSLYLPVEAQFALREIALTMRRAKPHDVMLEAIAELFEKYNKGDLAKECRRRIASRDKIVT